MFRKNLIPVWVGIILVSGMFLMGQESNWPCTCTDNDGDGYGNPYCDRCTHPQGDCDDSNPDVNPGATEGPVGDPTCSDGLNNDCDYGADMDDSDCTGGECFDIDGDGYWGGMSCPGGWDCNDDPSDNPSVCDTCSCGVVDCAPCAYCQHPGAMEFPNDGVDSNCNGQDN